MDLGGGFHCASQKTREHFYFILTGQLCIDQLQSSSAQTAGRLFFSSRSLAIMPSKLNVVFPCLKKSEAQKKDRSLIIYLHEEL